MKIFAISDLHLSLSAPPGLRMNEFHCYKPMEVFGCGWKDFFPRLDSNWRSCISEEDAVLIPGDISWAMHLQETKYDFDYLATLPGKKIILKGNHDYWWQSVSQVRSALPENLFAIQNDAYYLPYFTVCGTRGWLLPDHNDFKAQTDTKIHNREILRLEMSLKQASSGNKPIIVMLHYPPLISADKPTDYVRVLSGFNVVACLYGHIHGDKSPAFEGEYAGIYFQNCSADRLSLMPKLIAEDATIKIKQEIID